MTHTLEAWFDGSCNNRSRSRWMGAGAILKRGDLWHLQALNAGAGGTSNQAEYVGLCRALQMAKDEASQFPDDTFILDIYSDSQVVVNQWNGAYSVKDKVLADLLDHAKAINSKMGNVFTRLKWQRRAQNKEADRLSQIAHKLDKMCPKIWTLRGSILEILGPGQRVEFFDLEDPITNLFRTEPKKDLVM